MGFLKILLHAGIIDNRGHWQAKNTCLIQLGDILGRGGEPGKIFRLLQHLAGEAPGNDSSVQVLLGNHEAMSMSGLLMYNTVEEFRDLAEEGFLDPRDLSGDLEFCFTLSPLGDLGKWLRSHDSAVVINETLFVHGGLNREYGCKPLDRLNRQIQNALAGYTPLDVNRDLMLKQDGPQWNRDFVLRPTEEKESELEEVLNYHGCRRMVVGHTPTSCIDSAHVGRIVPLYDGKLLCIDTGIGKSYGGNLSALSLAGGEVLALYPEGAPCPLPEGLVPS